MIWHLTFYVAVTFLLSNRSCCYLLSFYEGQVIDYRQVTVLVRVLRPYKLNVSMKDQLSDI